MGDIVNLRQFRKRQARDEALTEAARNRARTGVPSAKRKASEKAEALRVSRLEGHRIEGSTDAGKDGASNREA